MSRRDNAGFQYSEFINLQLFGIDMLFNDLKNYQNLIEDFLSREKKKLEEEYDVIDFELESKKAGDNHREYYNHLIDSYSERHHEIAGLFPHHFRCFFLTQTMAVIEAEFKKLCNSYGHYKGQKFYVEDMKGSSDLEKCKEYIVNLHPMDFNDFADDWQFIKNCKELRNKIVHEEGLIKKTNKAIVQFIESHPSLSHSKYVTGDLLNFSIENNALALELLNHAENFFQVLLYKLAEADRPI
ncbi:hypothetical protein PN465_08615 [Nodularia spumigena CS-584]|uniref:hypothetical protein n=1 Tax=Nodularia spumigena TaxID=70799 RepID=UPI000DB80B98|nr:hypothetical protein [Nodularia spumigena]MDB9382284.1 hypothetical protein [Nodularia spumigena CS-584]PZR24214.1 MAG: hypothetical protein DI539_00620 [Flavobacterium psychrophilum]